MLNLRGLSVVVASAFALAGCVGQMTAPTPLRLIEYANPSGPAKCLFVFLPGMGDRAEYFERKGFVAEMRAHGLSVDVRAADATFGYYMRGSFLDRLSADVIAPAKSRGYQEIWIAGPSMGGFGALFYTHAYTADISGVLAIAPFLGDAALIDEIKAAGGLETWKASERVEHMDRSNYQREMWRWLQAVTQGNEPSPPIYLGYGASDKLAATDELLAAELPPSHVFRIEGEHEWGTWRRVLKSFLESPEFAGRCRAEPAVTPVADANAGGAVDAVACRARGGEVRPVCRRQVPRCVVRHPDAGQPCTDSSQCKGRCLVDGARPLESGEAAKGRCEEDDDPCGCKIEVKNGKVTGGICVD